MGIVNDMNYKKKIRKFNKNNPEIWTEEQYEQYMKGLYGLDFIAGYTEGGVPYGTTMNYYMNEIEFSVEVSYSGDGEDLPFR